AARSGEALGDFPFVYVFISLVPLPPSASRFLSLCPTDCRSLRALCRTLHPCDYINGLLRWVWRQTRIWVMHGVVVVVVVVQFCGLTCNLRGCRLTAQVD
ncbi:uncharacterized, partial [Tachysurus ichikawai]